MPTRIDAEIGLNASKFRQGLDAAGKGVSDFVRKGEREFDKLGLSINDLNRSNQELRRLIGSTYNVSSLRTYNRALAENEAELRRIAQIAGQTSNELNQVGGRASRGFSGANNAILSFSQGIQDLPFGIRGVANNITQLTTNLGFLAAEAKTAGVSMKTALLGSLANPATLAVIAVSAITTGIQILSETSRKAAKDAKTLEDALNSAAASVAGEVSEFEALVSIARDAGQGLNAQQAAVERLNDEYDIFNGTLTVNNVNSEENTELIDKQTEALIRQAKIKGALDRITELSNKQLEIQNSGIKENTNAWDFLTSSILTGGNAISANARLSTEALKNRSEALSENAQDIETFKSALRELLAIDLAEVGSGVPKGAVKARKEIEGVSAAFVRLQKDITDLNALSIGTRQAAGFFNIGQQLQTEIAAVTPQFASYGEIMASTFSDAFSDILSSGVSDGIANMASSFGKALAEGGNVVDAIGGALLDGIGRIATELGKAAIAIGVGMLAIKAAFKNPFTAIAAGVALVAIGGAISAAASIPNSIGSSGGGSSASGATGGNVSVASANTSGFQGTVVFEIAGRSLVGVLRREAQHGNRITP